MKSRTVIVTTALFSSYIRMHGIKSLAVDSCSQTRAHNDHSRCVHWILAKVLSLFVFLVAVTCVQNAYWLAVSVSLSIYQLWELFEWICMKYDMGDFTVNHQAFLQIWQHWTDILDTWHVYICVCECACMSSVRRCTRHQTVVPCYRYVLHDDV
jgi:hypothetical protein